MSYLKSVLDYVTRQRLDPSVDRAKAKRAVEDAWGLVEADRSPTQFHSSSYDWTQWRKQLQRVLDGLPATELEWGPMMAEARALGFGESMVRNAKIEEFTLLIRRVVADCVLTAEEQEKLESARRLLALTADEAELISQGVVKEAVQFFGKPLRDET
jgi:hypothetical protein